MKKSFLFTASLLVLGPLAYVNSCNASSFTPEIGDVPVPVTGRVVSHSDTASIEKYRQTEEEFIQTTKEFLEANKSDAEYHNLEKSLYDLGSSLRDQIDQGVQGKLLSAQVEKNKRSFKSKVRSKLERVKEAFGLKDKKEELNVLCLDGGGMRGIGTLVMLSALEMKTGKKICELFHKIYGTSTGGLMAIMLARGYSATKVLDIYFENLDKIFYRSWSDTFTNPLGLFAATYNPAGLKSVIEKYAGEGSLKDVKIPVAVTTVDSSTQEVILLSSEDEETRDVSFLAAARATSAAPTYFPAQLVPLKSKKVLAVDGGVGANNPSEEAYNHIKRLGKQNGKQYKINLLSLGTGAEEKIRLDANAGKLGFGNPGNIPGYFMGANEAKIAKHMEDLSKEGALASYNRYNFKLPFKIDLADTSELAKKKVVELGWQASLEKDGFGAYIAQVNERLKKQAIASKKEELKKQKKMQKTSVASAAAA